MPQITTDCDTGHRRGSRMHPERDASKVAKRERRSTVCKSLAPRQPALDEAVKRILDQGGILILCAYWAVMAKNRDLSLPIFGGSLLLLHLVQAVYPGNPRLKQRVDHQISDSEGKAMATLIQSWGGPQLLRVRSARRKTDTPYRLVHATRKLLRPPRGARSHNVLADRDRSLSLERP
jgi:hypothetical protein